MYNNRAQSPIGGGGGGGGASPQPRAYSPYFALTSPPSQFINTTRATATPSAVAHTASAKGNTSGGSALVDNLPSLFAYGSGGSSSAVVDHSSGPTYLAGSSSLAGVHVSTTPQTRATVVPGGSASSAMARSNAMLAGGPLNAPFTVPSYSNGRGAAVTSPVPAVPAGSVGDVAVGSPLQSPRLGSTAASTLGFGSFRGAESGGGGGHNKNVTSIGSSNSVLYAPTPFDTNLGGSIGRGGVGGGANAMGESATSVSTAAAAYPFRMGGARTTAVGSGGESSTMVGVSGPASPLQQLYDNASTARSAGAYGLHSLNSTMKSNHNKTNTSTNATAAGDHHDGGGGLTSLLDGSALHGGAAAAAAGYEEGSAESRYYAAIWAPQLAMASASYQQLHRARIEAMLKWTPAMVATQLNMCRSFHGLSMLVDAKVIHAYANYCEEVMMRHDADAQRLIQQNNGHYYVNGDYAYAYAPRTAEEEAERGNTTTLGVLQRDLAALRFVTENTKSMHAVKEGEVDAARRADAKERERLEARGVPTEVLTLRAGPPFYQRVHGQPERLMQRLPFGEALFLNNVDGSRLLALTEDDLVAHFGLAASVARVAMKGIHDLTTPSAIDQTPLPSTLKELLAEQRYDLELAAADEHLFYLHTTSTANSPMAVSGSGGGGGGGGGSQQQAPLEQRRNPNMSDGASRPTSAALSNGSSASPSSPSRSAMARRASTSYYHHDNIIMSSQSNNNNNTINNNNTSFGGESTSASSVRSPMQNRLPNKRTGGPSVAAATASGFAAFASSIGMVDRSGGGGGSDTCDNDYADEDNGDDDGPTRRSSLLASQMAQAPVRGRVGDGVDFTNEAFKKWSNLSRAGQMKKVSEQRQRAMALKQLEADAVAKVTEVDPSHLTPIELLRIAGGSGDDLLLPAEAVDTSAAAGKKKGGPKVNPITAAAAAAKRSSLMYNGVAVVGGDGTATMPVGLEGDDDEDLEVAAINGSDLLLRGGDSLPSASAMSKVTSKALAYQTRVIGILERERRNTVLKDLHGTIRGYFALQEALGEAALAEVAGDPAGNLVVVDSDGSFHGTFDGNNPIPLSVGASGVVGSGVPSTEGSGLNSPFNSNAPPMPTTDATGATAAAVGGGGIVRPHSSKNTRVSPAIALQPRPNSAMQRIARVTFQNEQDNIKFNGGGGGGGGGNAALNVTAPAALLSIGGGSGGAQTNSGSSNAEAGGSSLPPPPPMPDFGAVALETSASPTTNHHQRRASTRASSLTDAASSTAAAAYRTLMEHSAMSGLAHGHSTTATPLTVAWLVHNCIQPVLRLPQSEAEALTHRLARTLQKEYVLLERAEALVALEEAVRAPKLAIANMTSDPQSFNTEAYVLHTEAIKDANRAFKSHIRRLQGEEEIKPVDLLMGTYAKPCADGRSGSPTSNAADNNSNIKAALRGPRGAIDAVRANAGKTVIPLSVANLAVGSGTACAEMSVTTLLKDSATTATASVDGGAANGVNDVNDAHLNKSPPRGRTATTATMTPDRSAKEGGAPPSPTINSRGSGSNRNGSPTAQQRRGGPQHHRLLSSPLYRPNSTSSRAERELAIVILHAHHATQKAAAIRQHPELLAPSYSTGFQSAFTSAANGSVASSRARRGSLFGSSARTSSPPRGGRGNSSPFGGGGGSPFSPRSGASSSFYNNSSVGDTSSPTRQRPLSRASALRMRLKEKEDVERRVLDGTYSFEEDFKLSAEAFAFSALEATLHISNKLFDFIIEYISDRFGTARVEELRRRSVISAIFADACEAYRPLQQQLAKQQRAHCRAGEEDNAAPPSLVSPNGSRHASMCSLPSQHQQGGNTNTADNNANASATTPPPINRRATEAYTPAPQQHGGDATAVHALPLVNSSAAADDEEEEYSPFLLTRKALAQLVNAYLLLEHRSTSAAVGRLRSLNATPSLHSTTNHTSRLNARAAMFIGQDEADDCFLFTLNLTTRNRLLNSQRKQHQQQQEEKGNANVKSGGDGGNGEEQQRSARSPVSSLRRGRSNSPLGGSIGSSSVGGALLPRPQSASMRSGLVATHGDAKAEDLANKPLGASNGGAGEEDEEGGVSFIMREGSDGGGRPLSPTQLSTASASSPPPAAVPRTRSDLSANVLRITKPPQGIAELLSLTSPRLNSTAASPFTGSALVSPKLPLRHGSPVSSAAAAAAGQSPRSMVDISSSGHANTTRVVMGKSGNTNVAVMPPLINRETFIKFVADEWLTCKSEAFDQKILLLRTCVMAKRMDRDRQARAAAAAALLEQKALAAIAVAAAADVEKADEPSSSSPIATADPPSPPSSRPVLGKLPIEDLVMHHAARDDVNADGEKDEDAPMASVSISLELKCLAAGDGDEAGNEATAVSVGASGEERSTTPTVTVTLSAPPTVEEGAAACAKEKGTMEDEDAASATSRTSPKNSRAASPTAAVSAPLPLPQPRDFITQEGFEALCASTVTDPCQRPIVVLIAPERILSDDGQRMDKFSIYPAVLVEQYFWNAKSYQLRRNVPHRFANNSFPALKQQQPQLYSIGSQKALGKAIEAMSVRGGMARGHWYYIEFTAEGLNRHPIHGEEGSRRGAQWPPQEGFDLAGTRSVIAPSPLSTARGGGVGGRSGDASFGNTARSILSGGAEHETTTKRVSSAASSRGGGGADRPVSGGRHRSDSNGAAAAGNGAFGFTDSYKHEIKEDDDDDGASSSVAFGGGSAYDEDEDDTDDPFGGGRGGGDYSRNSPLHRTTHNVFSDEVLAADYCGGLMESFLRQLSCVILQQRQGAIHPSFRVFVRYPSLKISSSSFPTIGHRTCHVIDLVAGEAVVKFD